MNRKEIYAIIKKNKWEDNIKNRTGRNYTNCSNAVLYLHINILTQKENQGSIKKNPVQFVNVNIIKVLDKVDKLIEVLEKKHILLKSEIDYINK